MTDTIRLTVAQAVVTYLSRQYSVADGHRRRLIPATLGIFGHGNVAGLGQALDQLSDAMPFIQGRNEQALVHAAVGYAKHSRRHATLAVTASIGPGAMNMVTGAALATVNRLPGAAAARATPTPPGTRARCCSSCSTRSRPTYRQRRVPAGRPVLRPDHPARAAADRAARRDARAGRPGRDRRRRAVPAAGRAVPRLRLPRRVLRRTGLDDPPAGCPTRTRSTAVAGLLAAAEKPLIIAGGGVIYSDATAELERLAAAIGAPGRRDLRRQGRGADRPRGGRSAASGWRARRPPTRWPGEADLVLTVGSRLTDFATGSHSHLRQPGCAVRQHQRQRARRDRLGATGIVGDAKRGPGRADRRRRRAGSPRRTRVAEPGRGARRRLGDRARGCAEPRPAVRQVRGAQPIPTSSPTTDAVLTQGQIIGVLQEHARPGDVIVAAAGGPPGDLQKVWDATGGRTCHLEFGFSCMGYEIPAAMGVRMAHPDPPRGSPRSSATGPS